MPDRMEVPTVVAMPESAVAKALLVDDRKDNLIALEAILQGLPVEPVAVESGAAALKQLLIDDFAVILLDAQMPEMDGFETASHIKHRERTRHVPIIFLTAKAMPGDRESAIAAGASDYITKPVDLDELLELMASWVSGTAGA